MKNSFIRQAKLVTLLMLCIGVSSCEEPQIYGSVGISSYGGGGYHGGYGTRGSIAIGGRIY
jgi:hypothetical protein